MGWLDRFFGRRGKLETAEPSGIAEAVKKAAMAGDVAALKKLIDAHGGTKVRLDADPAELTALHWAAASGNVEAVRFLLAPQVGANPRAARNNNFTPLHSASMQGHAAACELLLAAGAGVNVQTDPQGYAGLMKWFFSRVLICKCYAAAAASA